MKSTFLAAMVLLLTTTVASGGPINNDEAKVKTYMLSAKDIRPLAVNRGGAIASDRITVEGKRVGYMYRNPPLNAQDSGWAFLAGDESEEELADASKAGIFDVNTIANYDPAIIQYLDAPVGSAFIRKGDIFSSDPLGAPND